MIWYKKSVVVGNAHIVPHGEEIPLELAETKTEPVIVADMLWMPYASYLELKDLILSNENEILTDWDGWGALFSVLQWVNRMEHEVRDSAPSTIKEGENGN